MKCPLCDEVIIDPEEEKCISIYDRIITSEPKMHGACYLLYLEEIIKKHQ